MIKNLVFYINFREFHIWNGCSIECHHNFPLDLQHQDHDWRQFIEDSTFSVSSWKHIGVDILWNILALFASYEPYWFWGIVTSQILTVTVIAYIADWKEDKKNEAKKNLYQVRKSQTWTS